MKKIVIAGGSGFLGETLTSYFKSKVEQIVILTRGTPRTDTNNVQFVYWDAENLGDWAKEINNADALINLTGKSVDCSYTKKNKALILNSRIASTKVWEKPSKHVKIHQKYGSTLLQLPYIDIL